MPNIIYYYSVAILAQVRVLVSCSGLSTTKQLVDELLIWPPLADTAVFWIGLPVLQPPHLGIKRLRPALHLVRQQLRQHPLVQPRPHRRMRQHRAVRRQRQPCSNDCPPRSTGERSNV